MAIRIIATGGTFDKQYDPINGKLSFEDTHLPEILQTARLSQRVELEIAGLIDSLEMGNQQREIILNACLKSPEDNIVIVHGTDTMTETARYIGKEHIGKCIVLTGAMVPYSVNRSDALFNLGTAVMAAGILGNGTWIAMNGRILRWEEAEKDKKKGVFVSRDTTQN